MLHNLRCVKAVGGGFKMGNMYKGGFKWSMGLGVWKINQRKDLLLFKNILLFLTKINFKRVLECSV